MNAYFDSSAFLQALNKVRKQRKLTWNAIQKEVGMSNSTIYFYTTGKQRINIDSLAALALWSGLDVHQFMKRKKEEGGNTPS